MNTTRYTVSPTLTFTMLLLSGGCGETFLNQITSLGGRTAGQRGSVRLVLINNTPHRAIFTLGSYDQTDPAFEPDYLQFGHRESGRILDGDSTSEILVLDCARVISVGGANLLRLIERNPADAPVDTDAAVEGVVFFAVPSEAPEADERADVPTPVGNAPAFEALVGVDFPCNALLIIRFEFDDVGPDPFRIDFELIPSESAR